MPSVKKWYAINQLISDGVTKWNIWFTLCFHGSVKGTFHLLIRNVGRWQTLNWSFILFDTWLIVWFVRRSWYTFFFYSLTLKTLLYGNASHLIAYLFLDWPNTGNLEAFEKNCIENWNCLPCVISWMKCRKI